MKIAAYEVREDEREMLERCAGQYHIHLSLSQDPFGSENAGACHDADGITTLGKSRLDAPMLEQLAAELAARAAASGYRRIIVAGGETSGAVIQRLGYQGFWIGRSIAPGVPVMIPLEDTTMRLVLKSGNFGQDDFFSRAVNELEG